MSHASPKTHLSPFAGSGTLLTSDLSANACLVAMTLRLFGDSDGKGIRPSIGTIVATTGLSERSVQRAIGSLLEAGFLTGERSKGSAPSRFELALPGDQPRQHDTVTPQFELRMQEQPRRHDTATPSNLTPPPRQRDTESSIISSTILCKGAKAIGALLPARPRASAPAQPKAPAARPQEARQESKPEPSRTPSAIHGQNRQSGKPVRFSNAILAAGPREKAGYKRPMISPGNMGAFPSTRSSTASARPAWTSRRRSQRSHAACSCGKKAHGGAYGGSHLTVASQRCGVEASSIRIGLHGLSATIDAVPSLAGSRSSCCSGANKPPYGNVFPVRGEAHNCGDVRVAKMRPLIFN